MVFLFESCNVTVIAKRGTRARRRERTKPNRTKREFFLFERKLLFVGFNNNLAVLCVGGDYADGIAVGSNDLGRNKVLNLGLNKSA